MLGRKNTRKADVPEVKRGFDAYDLQMGDVMRGERATMGKSLLDVQRELKIKATYIAAVENADPSVFESPGFIAGYVRSYAKYLNLDPEWAFERFCAESGFSGVEGLSGTATRASKNKSGPKLRAFGDEAIVKPLAPYTPAGETLLSRVEPGAIGSIAVIFALIGALGYGGWTVLQEVQRVQFAPVEQTPGVSAQIDSLSQSQGSIGGSFGSTQAADASPSTPDALDRLYRPQALEAPVLVARDGPIAALDPSLNGALAGVTSSEEITDIEKVAANTDVEPTTGVQVLAQNPNEVVLFAVRATWVQVSAEDGTVLLSKVLDKGETYAVPSEGSPKVRTGNAGGLYFLADGRTFGPSGGNGTVVKNIELNVASIETTYTQADLDRDPELVDVLVAMAESDAAIQLLDE